MAPVKPSKNAQSTSESVISRNEMSTACFMKIGVTTLSTITLVIIKPQATRSVASIRTREGSQMLGGNEAER